MVKSRKLIVHIVAIWNRYFNTSSLCTPFNNEYTHNALCSDECTACTHCSSQVRVRLHSVFIIGIHLHPMQSPRLTDGCSSLSASWVFSIMPAVTMDGFHTRSDEFRRLETTQHYDDIKCTTGQDANRLLSAVSRSLQSVTEPCDGTNPVQRLTRPLKYDVRWLNAPVNCSDVTSVSQDSRVVVSPRSSCIGLHCMTSTTIPIVLFTKRQDTSSTCLTQ